LKSNEILCTEKKEKLYKSQNLMASAVNKRITPCVTSYGIIFYSSALSRCESCFLVDSPVSDKEKADIKANTTRPNVNFIILSAFSPQQPQNLRNVIKTTRSGKDIGLRIIVCDIK
jgi:hypothetical protein